MNARVFFWSLTSALAGFLFGFDTVVISGAEKTIQSLWGLSPGWHGIAMASALYGTVVGSLIGGWPADRFGRKATLLWIGILYFVGAVGSGLATNVSLFNRSSSAVHLGNCATEVSWTTCRHVSVQHCFWNPDRFRIQRAARRRRRECLALDAWCRRVPVTSLRSSLLRPSRKPALAAGEEGRSRGRSGSAATNRTQCPESRDRSRGGRDYRCVLGKSVIIAFLDASSAQTDPACRPDCVL